MENSSYNIYTNGVYLQQNPAWNIEDAPWKAHFIHEMIIKNRIPVSHITEVGCGAGGILQELSVKDCNILTLTGYDISPDAIAIAKPKADKRLSFFQEDFLGIDASPTDLILVIDVLEHLDDYYTFLSKLKKRSAFFIFHIPLDLCCRTLFKPHVLLQQREAVGHIHYYSREMVLWFLKDTGYEIIDWHYTKPVVDTLPPHSVKRRIKKLLRNLSFTICKDLSATLWGGYSMMILAK